MIFFSKSFYLRVALWAFCASLSSIGVAQSDFGQPVTQDRESAYDLPKDPQRPRSRLAPVASLFLPGLDQWIEGQYDYALGYSLTHLVGIGTVYSLNLNDESEEMGMQQDQAGGFSEQDQRFLWGSQLQIGAGGMSAFHAFRSMVETQKPLGRYGFLNNKEEPLDVLAAPFDFSYLSRATTYVPLALAAYLHLGIITADKETLAEADLQLTSLSSSDVFYAGALSYGAGVWEEAVFRGWLLPEFMEITGSRQISNAVTSILFGAAHLNSTSVPWIQLALGWYFGDLTMRNQWAIGESVFIHAWWDVFAFLTAFRLEQAGALPEAADLGPMYLPRLEWRF